MQTISFHGYRAEFDRSATRNWYASAEEWGCECAHCRNFLALAKKKALPESVMCILNELGIPSEKATYVGELYTDEKGVHYQFSYRLAGTILAEPKEPEAEGRCCHEPYPYGAPGFPAPHFDLEFWETLPWILDEK